MCTINCGDPNLGKRSTKAVYIDGVCAVCEGMDNDTTIKKVFFCDLCEENICDACTFRIAGRGIMALKKLFKFGKYAKAK